MSKEYIIEDNVCPACGQPYSEHNIRINDRIKCGYCNYEKLLRTPLQKKRENIVIKNYVGTMVSFMNITLITFTITFLPLILYVLLGPKNPIEIRAEYPVGSIVYLVAIIWVYVLMPLVICVFRCEYARVRKNGYSMEWIRSQYAKDHKKGKHNKAVGFTGLDNWEEELRKHKEAIS